MDLAQIDFTMRRGDPVYWRDPDPIPNRDYRINSIHPLDSVMAYIVYNKGRSEAEVLLDELSREP